MLRGPLYRMWRAFFRAVEGTPVAWALWRLPGSRRAFRSVVSRVRPPMVLLEGHTVHLDATDSLGIALRGNFEDTERRLFEDVVPEGGTVLDVGAHIGVYTLLAARGVGPRGRVHAFEPLAENLSVLVTNITANGYGDRVTIHPCALGSRDETVALGVSLTNTGNNTMTAALDFTVQVACRRADTLLPDVVPGVVKIDVEGAELAALRGAAALLEQVEDLTIFSEVNSAHLPSVAEYLTWLWDHGLTTFVIDEEHAQLHAVSDIQGMAPFFAGNGIANVVALRGSDANRRLTAALARQGLDLSDSPVSAVQPPAPYNRRTVPTCHPSQQPPPRNG